MNDIETIRQRLNQIDEEIAEAKRRLPAHTIRPITMAPLLDLEDEQDRLLRQLEALKSAAAEAQS